MSTYIGKTIDRYRIVEQIGMGGMATVYKAFDTRLERYVAIKIIRSGLADESFLARFEREAKALAQMDHPHILKVLDYGDQDGLPYLVMIYLPGGTLKQRLGSPIPYSQAAGILLPIAQALEYAHGMKIIHRDVKPANILLTASGLPMLSDFGIAKLMESDASLHLTSTGMGIGTPEYMAPEQWLGKVVPQTDIYALGIIFYEMITGRRPYTAETPAAILLKLTNDPLPRPRTFIPSLPDSVERTIFKALAKRPQDRFESMGKFAAVLGNLAQGIEPEIQVSYEGTQMVSQTSQADQTAMATARALMETAQTLESQGNHGAALELFRRASTIATPDSLMHQQIEQSIKRLEKLLVSTATPSLQTERAPQAIPVPKTLRETETVLPVNIPAKTGGKRWGWLWAVGGVTLVGIIAVVALGILGLSSLIKSRNETPVAEIKPTKTVVETVQSTTTSAPTRQPTLAATPPPTLSPAETQAEALPTAPQLSMPLQSVVNQSCGSGDIIKSIEAVDPMTVKFTLCTTDPAFLAKLAIPDLGIQPADYVIETGGGGTYFTGPVGTGPYALDKWVSGYSITFKKFDGYHGEPAIEDKVTVIFGSSDEENIQKVLSGQADLTNTISVNNLNLIAASSNLQLITQELYGLSYIGMNSNFEPFNDVRFRQALALGIDRNALIQSSFPEGYAALSYPDSCSIPQACAGDPWYDFDLARAKELLAEAGYSSGLSLKIYVRDVIRSNLPEPQAVAENLQQQLQSNLNITSEIQVYDNPTFLNMVSGGTADGLFLLGWTDDYRHPTNFLSYGFNSDQGIFGSYPEITNLLQAAQVDPLNNDIYTKIYNQIRQDVPYIPLSDSKSFYAANKNLKNSFVSAFNQLNLSQMSTGTGNITVISYEPTYLYCAVESWYPVCQQIVETLVTYDQDGTIIPLLAKSWDVSKDNLEYTFYLQSGILFHNGSMLNANDVILTYSSLLDASSKYNQSTDIFGYSGAFGLMND